MGGEARKTLMELLTVFMVCLIVSTAATTVNAQEGWGTLKVGDEVEWQSQLHGTVTMEILSVEGDIITLELNEGGSKETLTIDANEDVSSTNMQTIDPYLISIANEDDYNFSSGTYDFKNTTYQAYYSETETGGGELLENWRDTNTGILFESRRTEADGTVNVRQKLISTNAGLAVSTGSYGTGTDSCLGTLFIALFSVTAIISYSLIRLRKKEVA